MIHFYIILPPTPRSLKWSLSFIISKYNSIGSFICPMRAASLTHLILLDCIPLTMLDVEYKLRIYSFWNFLQPPLSSSLLTTIYIFSLTGFEEFWELCRPNLYVRGRPFNLPTNEKCIQGDFDPNTLLSTLFWNNSNLCSFGEAVLIRWPEIEQCYFIRQVVA